VTDPGATPPDGGMVVPPPRVEALILVDASTGKDIRPIVDMAQLDLAQLPPTLTVRADTDPPTVGSVVFRIDAGQPRNDSMAPYSISSDGNFAPWTLALGAHTINAVAFDAANGGGRPGEPLEIDFTLSNSTPPAAPSTGPVDAGVGVGARAGAGGGLPLAGNGVAMSPQLGAPLDASIPAIAARQNQDTTGGCACRVPGTGVRSSETPRNWGLAVFALGLFIWRRRSRTRSR
jgi:MYXO-CTERM domain-containing protein